MQKAAMQKLFLGNEDVVIGGKAISRAEGKNVVTEGYIRFVVTYWTRTWGARIGFMFGIGAFWNGFGKANDLATIIIGLVISASFMLSSLVAITSTWFRMKDMYID
jgi:hypothetical protein